MKGRRVPPSFQDTSKPIHMVISRDFDDRALGVIADKRQGDVGTVQLTIFGPDMAVQEHIRVSIETLRKLLCHLEATVPALRPTNPQQSKETTL